MQLITICFEFKFNRWITNVVNVNAYNGDDEYISVVYSIALEKLNKNMDDHRTLSIIEDGDSIRIKINHNN